MHGTFVPKNFNVTHFTSLHFTSKQNHFTPHHYTSHHFTYLHSIPTPIPLLVTTFLTLFLKVFSLQGKDANKPSGNWFQLLMVLFTKEYSPTSVLCFLVLIFWLWSHEMHDVICRVHVLLGKLFEQLSAGLGTLWLEEVQQCA